MCLESILKCTMTTTNCEPSTTVESHDGRTPDRSAPDPLRQFDQLVASAVDHFHRGDFDLSVVLLGLSERWVVERRLEARHVDQVRAWRSQTLDAGAVRKAAESPEHRSKLSEILRFFPAYSPARLLQRLRFEPRRDERRGLLLVLETLGEPARAAALEGLRAELDDSPDADDCHFRRNLLHLLRRLPGREAESSAEEVDLALRHCRIGLPSSLVKEAVGLLGQIRQTPAESALIRLLLEVEGLLPYWVSFGETLDLPAVAERIAAALTHFESARARRTVVDYAEKSAEAGRPLTFLRGLGGQDLSADEALIERLIGLLRPRSLSELSRRFRTRSTELDAGRIVSVIGALSGTDLPMVRRALERIVRRQPDDFSARAASQALVRFAGGSLDRRSA